MIIWRNLRIMLSSGELWDKAVSYQGQAGTKALACSANREAVGFFDKALDALCHLPKTRKNLEAGLISVWICGTPSFCSANSAGFTIV